MKEEIIYTVSNQTEGEEEEGDRFQNINLSLLHSKFFNLWDRDLSKFIANLALKSLGKTQKMNASSCNSLRKAMTKRETKINKNSLAGSSLTPVKQTD